MTGETINACKAEQSGLDTYKVTAASGSKSNG